MRDCDSGGYGNSSSDGVSSNTVAVITQSQKADNNGVSTPRYHKEKNLVVSAPTDVDKTTCKLDKGISIHQIFSTKKYIFKISSRMDKLYRKQFHREPLTNEVEDTVVYKQVKYSSLREDEKKLKGASLPYCEKKYDIYPLFTQEDKIRGYMLCPQGELHPRIYFEFEKRERRRQR